MTRDEIHALVMSLPGVEEGASYGKPAYKLGGKFFTRMRVVDEAVVLKISFEEREMLLEAAPEVYFLTDHYAPWPYVLAWIEKISPEELRAVLVKAWRQQAPKKLQKQHPEMANG
jgi:hypothetical protein